MTNRKKRWTSADIKFLIKNSSMKDEDIAQKLNRSKNSIRNKRIRLGINKKFSTIYSINSDFFKYWNNKMAYILGYIFADGSIRIRKSGMELSIKSIDFEILEAMNIKMKSNYPISKESTETGGIFRLSIYKGEIVEYLIKLGVIPRKSLMMTFPNIPDQDLFHFIRGYFDGDGHVRIIRNSLDIIFTSGSESFLEDLKYRLEGFGIKSSIRSPSKHSFYNLRILRENREYFVKMLYNNNAKLYLHRKKVVFDEFYQYYYPLKITCIDCGKEVKKTGKNQKRCKECAKQRHRELNRIAYKKRLRCK